MATAGLIVYAAAGPLLAWAVVLLTILGRRRMARLGEPSRVPPLDPPLPRVRVFVPVRDEVDGVAACVASVLGQDYDADRLDLVVVDDRSTDGTRDVLASLDDPRLTVLHVDALPGGWLGKPHALHAAVAECAGSADWFLFVDSDVRLEPEAVRLTIALATARGYDAVSLLTRLVVPTLLEQMLAPLVATAWLTTFRASDTNNDGRPASAVANGQFLLARPDALAAAGGHAAVRDQTCEDVALFRRMKAGGRRVRLFVGPHLVATRMHATWRQLLNGWARNFAGTARHRPTPILAAMLLLALQLAPLAVVFVGGWWTLAAVAHLAATTLWALLSYRWAGLTTPQTLRALPLWPASIALLLVLLGNGVRACLGGTVLWRGSRVRA